MRDVELDRSERPDWVLAYKHDLNVRFQEIALHCREVFRDLMGARPLNSLRQHKAALSALQTLGVIN